MAKDKNEKNQNIDEMNPSPESASEEMASAAETTPKRRMAWLYDDRYRFIAGLVILFVGALMCLAFSSFLSSAGKADASAIANGQIYADGARNWIGSLGAVMAEFCINRWLGVAAFLYAFFCLQLGYRLTRNMSLRPLFPVFVHYALWSIWISLACGFFFVDSYQDSYIYLGGHHGYDLEQYLQRLIGWTGVLLLLIITLLILLAFVTRSTIGRFRSTVGAAVNVGHKLRDGMRHHNAAVAADGGVSEEEEEPTFVADAPVVDDDPSEGFVADEPAAVADDDVAPAEVAPDAPSAEPAAIEPAPASSAEGFMADETRVVDMPAVAEESNVVEDEPSAAPAPVEPVATSEEEATIETGDPTFSVTRHKTEVLDKPIEQPLEDYDPTKDLEYYKFPTFDLLKEYNAHIPVDLEEQNENMEKIRQTLLDYGVEIQSINATVGPTITLFEIVLVSGTKINTIKRLSDEIAMSIASRTGIRIIAPIPGKSAIGIEVPNKDPQTVSMRECIQSRAFQESKAALPVALGKTITNEVFTFDLAKAPHMLVAGATGQGKSVGLNAIITSLLYKKHPSQLKIVLVDPKMVEFSVYSNIDKHFLAKLPDAEDPIITDVSKVVQTLKSLCAEMEDRYALLREAGCRKLEEYNDKFIHRQLNPNKHIDAPIGSKEGTHHHFLPYIVAIIDEYGDLIMTAGKEVELPIARIAQKARAVGIHMIIATQRPSAKIVTGIIKANFPARIAFRVSSATDSSIILDQSGAQNLVGRGDLFISLGDKFERVQCAFVDTPEVQRINKFIEEQQGYPTCYILPEPKPDPNDAAAMDEGGASAVDLNQLDPLFDECAELVVASGQGSTSMIQRKFGIGYNRAGRIMDQMEAAGIVGPYQGSKARAVLVEGVAELQNLLEDLKNR